MNLLTSQIENGFHRLKDIIPIYRFDEVDQVDWAPKPVNMGKLKLQLLDHFASMVQRWQVPELEKLDFIYPVKDPENPISL